MDNKLEVRSYGPSLVAAALLAAGAAAAWAAGVSPLPDAAKRTVERFGNGGTIEKVVREEEDGLQVLAITQNQGGTRMEVQTTLAGDLNATEEALAPGDLPPQVLLAAQKRFPKGLLSAEKSVAVMYEVEGKDAAGKVHEVRITLPGVVLVAAAPPAAKSQDVKQGAN